MPLSATMELSLKTSMTGAQKIERLESKIDKIWRMVLGDGNGANQANKVFSDTRTLASNTSENLDLVGGLTDSFGASIALSKIKAIIIVADPANTTTLTVGNVANGIVAPFGAATQSISVPPGGMFMVANPGAAGFAVTDATADLLKIANAAGGSANYDVVIIGAA